MKFSEFREKVKNYPFFRSNAFDHWTDNVPLLRRQISEWISKKNVVQLKRGYYTLCPQDRAVGLSMYYLANHLYSPSYISLESALSFYAFIPERVEVITSVATKKTQTFINPVGKFMYHQIKASLYDDFIKMKDEDGRKFFIASAERAIIDYIYLKCLHIKNVDENIFEESFRWQYLDKLSKKKLLIVSKKFNSNKIDQWVQLLLNYMRKNYD